MQILLPLREMSSTRDGDPERASTVSSALQTARALSLSTSAQARTGAAAEWDGAGDSLPHAAPTDALSASAKVRQPRDAKLYACIGVAFMGSLTPSSSGAVGGTASSTDKQVFLVAHLPVRMAGQLSPVAPSLGAQT